jgi:hypothetical protein
MSQLEDELVSVFTQYLFGTRFNVSLLWLMVMVGCKPDPLAIEIEIAEMETLVVRDEEEE